MVMGSGGGVTRKEYNGTYQHPNDTSEHDIFSLTLNKPKLIHVRFDCSALSQTILLRTYNKIDGANYVEVDSVRRIVSDRKGVAAVDLMMGTDIKFTAQSVNAEGSVKSIPYRYVVES